MNPRVGVAVVLVNNGKVLLGKRHDDPIKADSEMHGEGTWTIPGGKLDYHEHLHSGASRKTLEETGIKVNDLELISVTNEIIPDKHFVTVSFLCNNFEGEAKVMEPDEITEWKWFDAKKLPSPMFPPAKKAIDNYLEKNIYSRER